MQRFVIGLVLGAIGALLWVVEAIRRSAEQDRAPGHLWPRPDGSERGILRPHSYGEVWEHPGTS